MKKKILIIISITVVLVLAVGGAYFIDKNRMANNEPIVFSTWGAKYAPPAKIIVSPNSNMNLENSGENIVLPEIEKRSFIATIIEEEPTYLIVEPNDGEFEKLQSNTRKILIPDGENRDYIYGVGRKVIITYDHVIQSDTNVISGADIDVDGYDNFELEVVESDKPMERKVLNNKEIDRLNSDYNLYYYGLEEVNVKVANEKMSLEDALKGGYLTLSGILAKANRDVSGAISYDDGGSREYQYATFVIIKYHTIDGNRDMYICKVGTTINDLNK